MTDDNWESDWDVLVARVGEEIEGGLQADLSAVEDVERASIRRFCEPVEFDCPLHYDDEVARAHGYEGVIAPYSSITQTFVDPGVWSPGDPPVYTSADAHAQPVKAGSGDNAFASLPGPNVSAGFATDVEIEYFQDVLVGDRLEMRGNRLLSCVPKETSVGRGAFMTFESNCYNQRGEKVATMRRGLYGYVPHSK